MIEPVTSTGSRHLATDVHMRAGIGMFLTEVLSNMTIEVAIPLDSETARTLENPARRAALGRYLDELLRSGRLRGVLAEKIAEAKREARANGLTDETIDTELEAWRSERRA